MVVNFFYCIDFPVKAHNVEQSDMVEGWLLCSHKIKKIKIAKDPLKRNLSFLYGVLRPDVTAHFKGFLTYDDCGFKVIAPGEAIRLKDDFALEVEVQISKLRTTKFVIQLDLNSSAIQEIEVDNSEKHSEKAFRKTEKKFADTLMKHPWITVRMDITNKCNLKCIMCHYKEEEIHSQPTKTITAAQLKHQLHDIAPYVKDIMLSCGFEPLMSKHFTEIVGMLHDNYPHMEIGMCTNGMLLNSQARKVIIEKNVSHVILSFDGATRGTLERIRVGAKYDKIISNIMALRDLKRQFNRVYPSLIMDFVLMNSNIHEGPAFVRMCAELGIEIIDFRHLVGNIYFSEHEEMMTLHKEKYNYYRQLIVEESKKYPIQVRLPEAFAIGSWTPVDVPQVDLTDFNTVNPDVQTEEVKAPQEIKLSGGSEADFGFLSKSSCLRPFNEIMIIDQEKILPCSYYVDFMGHMDDNNTLHSIFFNEAYSKVRRKKMQAKFDLKCFHCPIKSNLLPTRVEE